MERSTCERCDAPAMWEVVAHWHSFWACSEHDKQVIDNCLEHDVRILDIVDRRQ